jgi:hypothetical protein
VCVLVKYLNYSYSIDGLRKGKETYEAIILGLLKTVEMYGKKQEQLMKEGYEEMAEENLKIEREFELIEDSRDWEW